MSPSARWVDFVLRHRRLLWAVALVLAIPAGIRTGWLYAHLHSELEELLPTESPSVKALAELKARLGAHQFLGIVVDAGSREGIPAAERFLDQLATRVRAYPAGAVAAVRTGNDVEAAFLEKHGGLYLSLADLKSVRAKLEARRDYEIAKASGALLDDTEAAPSVDFSDVGARYEHVPGASRRGTRYTDEEKHLSVLLLELGPSSAGAAAAGHLMDRVEGDVDALRATDPEVQSMRMGYAGDAAIATEELRALVSDLSWSSVFVIAAVIGAIVTYYRWWRSIVVVLPPLLIATVYSFGLASLPPFGVQSVNSNTAFLASIIVGNGINFSLLLLSRYVEERRTGLDVRGSLVRAVEGSRGGTFAAATAASASYAALAITQFRGFRQFGYIGALGMLLALAAAFVLMPSLLAWVDTGEATRPKPVAERSRFSHWIARGVSRSPRAILMACVAVTLVAVTAIGELRATDLESDFSRLRRRDTWTVGEGYWGTRMNDVLGVYLTPLAFLADRPEDARAVATALRAKLGDAPFAKRIDSVRTIDDVLPSEQTAKLAELAAIQHDLTPAVKAALGERARDYVRPLADQALTPIAFDDLPRTFTLGLREHDGTLGRVVLVYPSPSGVWWHAKAMSTFVEALRGLAHQASPTHPVLLAGSIPLSSDIVEAISHDGPLASVAAFVLVVLVVLVVLRSFRTSAYVVGALVVGVAWLAGACHLFGVRINFANFIAFPITFGIGVDYAVNLITRYERDGSRDILTAVESTGGAVALCSLTTVIGYSSLLLAQNRALFLFGLVAVLGEVSCLTVALVALPALVVWRQRTKESRAITLRPASSTASG